MFGLESPSLAALLNNLGLILRNQGDAQGAEEAALRAITVSEAAFPPGHQFVSTTRANLGKLYSEQGRIAEMVPVYERALANAEASYGASHLSTILAAYKLASTQRQAGDFLSAESLYVDTILLHSEVLEEADPALIVPLSELGTLYLEYGNYDFAGDVLLEALVIAQANSGFNHISTTGLLQQLATLHMFEKEYEDSDLTLQRVRRIVEDAYGTDDPRLRPVLEQTGSLYMEMGRNEEAGLLFSEAAALPPKTP